MNIKRVGTYVAGATAAAAAAAMLTVAPATAAEEWAAIAYSPATGASGMGANVYHEGDAIAAAMRDCEASGGTDCQGVISISSPGCVALAISDDGAFSGGEGPDMATAAEHAVASNGGGRLHEFACALP